LLLRALKALGEQAEAAGLTEDVGNAGADVTGDPAKALDEVVLSVQAEKGVGYNEAFSIVQRERPELFDFVGGN
jgi:hypothetical protein